MSKHVRISELAYNRLNILKQSHLFTNKRFSIGDALDEIIIENDKLKQHLEWTMSKQS